MLHISRNMIDRHIGRLLLLAALAAASPVLATSKQVTDLAVRHHHGQTFITWHEVDSPELPDDIEFQALRKLIAGLERDADIRYRVYRSERPIVSTEAMMPIAEVGPLSCWNTEYYGVYPKKGVPPLRYVVREGDEPLAKSTGLYVHNPTRPSGRYGTKAHPMKSYYAVTYSKDGKENTTITGANATVKPVEEFEGQGVPILQRVAKPAQFAYIENPELHYYVRWEAPPNASVENKPIDYLVAVPPIIEKRPTPVGLHLHCWGGSLNGGFGWWYSYTKLGTTYLISSNQIPYDWWTGYHELHYTEERTEDKWKQGVVRPYTTTRMLSFLNWAAERYDLDPNRVFTAGSSMGGSGAPMFAIRHPDRIAWSIGWVGVHDPGNTPQFTGSYEAVYGKKDWGIKFEDNTPVFEYFKDATYLRMYPTREVGFITWSNGKNDGAIGWPQAVEFYRAMQETRRPHIFVWGLGGHGQRAVMPAGGGQRIMPLDIQLGQSLPAFTNCSLDDNPGTASKLRSPREVTIGRETKKDPYDGDSTGQINLYLRWDTDTIVDTRRRWEITVALIQTTPEKRCTVDITPRRLQQFRSQPNQKLRWSNVSEAKTAQSGEVIADEWGLVTLEKVVIVKAGSRISIWN
jgi:hypothetical protein